MDELEKILEECFDDVHRKNHGFHIYESFTDWWEENEEEIKELLNRRFKMI